MKTHVLMCLVLLLAGCSSLQSAGVSTYSVKAFEGQALSASVLPGVSENVTNWLR